MGDFVMEHSWEENYIDAAVEILCYSKLLDLRSLYFGFRTVLIGVLVPYKGDMRRFIGLLVVLCFASIVQGQYCSFQRIRGRIRCYDKDYAKIGFRCQSHGRICKASGRKCRCSAKGGPGIFREISNVHNELPENDAELLYN
ncbi:hypothetical protein ACF0H5_015488 [Mactra antiquata]